MDSINFWHWVTFDELVDISDGVASDALAYWEKCKREHPRFCFYEGDIMTHVKVGT